MANELFEKFNNMFNTEGLKEDMEALSNNTTERVKVPVGEYEVSIAKLELGENTYAGADDKGCPQLNVWFRVVAGEYKNNLIFWSTNINGKGDAFKLKKFTTFLETLETDIPVAFENFVQFGDLLKQIFQAVDGRAEYHLVFSENNKGFKEYTIVERF